MIEAMIYFADTFVLSVNAMIERQHGINVIHSKHEARRKVEAKTRFEAAARRALATIHDPKEARKVRQALRHRNGCYGTP